MRQKMRNLPVFRGLPNPNNSKGKRGMKMDLKKCVSNQDHEWTKFKRYTSETNDIAWDYCIRCGIMRRTHYYAAMDTHWPKNDSP